MSDEIVKRAALAEAAIEQVIEVLGSDRDTAVKMILIETVADIYTKSLDNNVK